MKKGGLVKRSIGIVLILLFAAACLVAVFDKDSNAAPPKKVAIGMLACLTGFFSGHDVPDFHEVQAVASMINARGGITVKGEKYQVEIVAEDCKSTLDGVTAAANRLIFDKGIKLIVGPTGYFAVGCAPVTNPNKVIDIMGYCTSQPGELDKTTPYTFLGHNGTVDGFRATIKYIKKHFPAIKKVVLLNADDGSIPYLTPFFKKALQAEGLSSVGDLVSFSNDTQDFSPTAAKLNAAKDAEAIFMVNALSTHAGSILKGLRELGNTKPFFMSSASTLQDAVNVAGTEAAKNAFFSGVTPNDPSNTHIMNELTKKITSEYGANTPMWVQSANSLWVLKQVIEAAQSFDPTAVKNKWEAMDKVETLFGPGRMGGEATYGIKNHVVLHPAPFQTLKDGKVVAAGYSALPAD